jgi:glycosyltransferase involved in cell wall biosynthesis/ubiquinone/menaquinone biosynthesis C-methylase UbiE
MTRGRDVVEASFVLIYQNDGSEQVGPVLKILTILTYYRPHWTGLTRHAVSIAEGLAARGHSVTALATRHDPSLAGQEVLDGVRVIRLQPVARFSRGLIAPAFPFVARRLIQEHDVVHIHTPLPESLLVAWLCRLMGRPFVMTHQGDLVLPAGVVNQAIQSIGTASMVRTEKLATRITTFTRDYAEHSEFLRPFLDKTTFLYPPIRVPEPNREAAAAWRAELGLADRALVGFAGRFVEEKGFDQLLRAIPELASREPRIHLAYAGELNIGYERFYDRCKPLVEAHRDRITFLGLLEDRQQLADFYAMCDIFVVPSRTDCFAGVQVESMLCGTPVVCSDIPGAREAVRVTGMGKLARSDEPRYLADAIVQTLGERPRYALLADEVRARFAPNRLLDGYERVLLNAASADTDALARADGRSSPSDLSARDLVFLDRILRNEVDMAYRRRARLLIGYLELRDGDRVLDCGCGMGFHLMAMQRLRELHLVGLDPDPDRLARAEREGVEAELVVGEAERLPFEDGSFDKILMTEVLEHLRDDRAALREIARVLRPGGVLAMSVPNARYPFLWDPISALLQLLGRPPIVEGPIVGIWTNHERLYTPEELAERVREAGLDVEAVEETTHYSVPFQHFLVYGIGKPLFERGLLPGPLHRSADRFAGEANTGRILDPLNLGRALFRLVDRLNERPQTARKRTHVNVLVKARKPLSTRQRRGRTDLRDV